MNFNFPRKFGHNAYGHNTLPSMEHFFVFLSYERTMVMLTWFLKKQLTNSISWIILLLKM